MNTKSRKGILVFCAVMLAAVMCASCAKTDLAYTAAVKHGYAGSAEEFAAALVGECAENAGASAYELACENGYKESLESWMKLLTGTASQATDKTAYDVAVEDRKSVV